MVLQPSLQAAITIREYTKSSTGPSDIGIGELIGALLEQTEIVNRGNLKRPEAMLAIQAHTLESIFNALALRAGGYAGEHMGACETYLRLALKAQSQCRATLDAGDAGHDQESAAFGLRQAGEYRGRTAASE
jgi:hypothetical protein